MIRSVLGSRASIGGVLGSGRGGAAAAWYLAGGVSAVNCVAAYQPKGAASLAASYVNLANPGTYDCTLGGTAPGWDSVSVWDSTNGWIFNNKHRLRTGVSDPVAGASGWSMIFRLSDAAASNNCAVGIATSTPASNSFAIFPYLASRVYYSTRFDNYAAPQHTSGTLAIAGAVGYRDGASDKALSGTGSVVGEIVIGARNITTSEYWVGKIQAVAIYNTTLTATQVAAISAAMAAL